MDGIGNASHAAINNSYVVYLLYFYRNWKSVLKYGACTKRSRDSRSGSVCWACCGKEHRNDVADDGGGDDDDDDDEDDIRVEVGTEKLAIVSGNCRNLNASRHQNIYWARKVVHFMTDSRWKYKWKYRQIEETREICALATYVIAYNFYRTTANQQGVKTRPHPAIRRGAVRKRGLHTINLWGSSQSQSQSQSFFFLTFSFRLENFGYANVSRQINKLLILLRWEQLPKSKNSE